MTTDCYKDFDVTDVFFHKCFVPFQFLIKIFLCVVSCMCVLTGLYFNSKFVKNQGIFPNKPF